MEYEYMALSSEDGAYAGQCRAAVRNKELADKGWKNWRMIPWYDSGSVSICVIRRELRHDEPRKWTRSELQDVIHEKLDDYRVLRAWHPTEDAQTEADMQTAYNEELLNQNKELQAAIDEVVNIARRRQGNAYRPYEDGRVPTHKAVIRLLEPLVSSALLPTPTNGPGGTKP